MLTEVQASLEDAVESNKGSMSPIKPGGVRVERPAAKYPRIIDQKLDNSKFQLRVYQKM